MNTLRKVLLLALVAACAPAARPVPGGTQTAIEPPRGPRYIVGGDSRNDSDHVVAWAFQQAKARRASAFFFLGDMELTPQLDAHFQGELAQLDAIPFYPVLGNHEIRFMGKMPFGQVEAEKEYREHFLETPRTPVHSSIEGRVVYSVDLLGGLHFVALDNVSQAGFGAEQLRWLSADLDRASANPATKYIVVGMHKPLARNGITNHSMDEDGPEAIAESDAALALFQKHHVALIVMSHLHEFDELSLGGIRAYVTGGLGAPLSAREPARGFHHFLQLDVGDTGIDVSVVRFEG